MVSRKSISRDLQWGNPLYSRCCSLLSLLMITVISMTCLTSCAGPESDSELTKNTYIELVDWHVSGLWVINCPVAWIRVANYNRVPVKDVTIEYDTYDYSGALLNKGTYTFEGSVAAASMKNFIEQYLGCVDLHSDKLSVKLLSVSKG